MTKRVTSNMPLLGTATAGSGARKVSAPEYDHLGGSVEYFHDMVFNYRTLAEAYKVAALDGLNKL
jgi:hypothetical protein